MQEITNCEDDFEELAPDSRNGKFKSIYGIVHLAPSGRRFPESWAACRWSPGSFSSHCRSWRFRARWQKHVPGVRLYWGFRNSVSSSFRSFVCCWDVLQLDRTEKDPKRRKMLISFSCWQDQEDMSPSLHNLFFSFLSRFVWQSGAPRSLKKIMIVP